ALRASLDRPDRTWRLWAPAWARAGWRRRSGSVREIVRHYRIVLDHVDHGTLAPPACDLHPWLVHHQLPRIIEPRVGDHVPARVHVCELGQPDRRWVVRVVR